jgi:hypothetical protein
MSDAMQVADELFDPAIELVIEVNETAIGQARMMESMEQTQRDTGHRSHRPAGAAGAGGRR